KYVETDAVDLQSTGHHHAVCKLSKIVDECLTRDSKAPCVITRMFTTIGPRLGRGLGNDMGTFVLQNMIRAIQGQTIVIDSNDIRSRVSLTDVTDIVHWMLLLACDSRAYGRVFNLGSPATVSVEQLANRILQVTDSQVGTQELILPGRDGRQPPPKIPDITQVVALTYYRPRAKLDDTLRKIYTWLVSEQGYRPILGGNQERVQQAERRGTG
ncbi:MAG: NAD-dependent epimerase/dehydratase family protein, partial [Pirellulaceae bacterium]